MSDYELGPEAVARQLRQFVPPIPEAKIAHALRQLRGMMPVKRGKRTAPSGAKKLRDLEAKKFRLWCKKQGLPQPVAEYWFAREAMGRNWRFDFCWVHPEGGGVALEVDGGVWSRGRHTRGAGFIEDQHKRNAAQELGFSVYHVTPQTLYTEATADMLKRVLG